MSLLKFVDEQEGNNPHTKAAIEMLLSTPYFNEEIKSKSCRRNQRHECIVALFQDALRPSTRTPGRLTTLTNALMKYLLNVGVYEDENQPIDPMDMVTGVLVNFHCIEVTKECFENEEKASQDCYNRCVLHKNYFLGVDETYTCQCGKSFENKWDSNNTCQFYNISGIFEEYDESVSKNLAILPNFVLKREDIEGSAKHFTGKIHEKLFERLEAARAESCENDNCRYKDSTISFRVTCEPRVYMMDLIWNSKETSHTESFLATLGFKNYFHLREIFKDARNRYKLTAVLFYGRDFYRLAQFKQGWCMEGLYENATWKDLLNETLLLNLHPITVIYVKADEDGQQFNLDSYELKELEQLAAQSDLCLERGFGPVIELDKLSTGFFTRPKYQIAEEVKKNNETSRPPYFNSESEIQKVQKLNENYFFEEEERKREQRRKEIEDKNRELERKNKEDELNRERENERRLRELERKNKEDELNRERENERRLREYERKKKENEIYNKKEPQQNLREDKKNAEYRNNQEKNYDFNQYNTSESNKQNLNPNQNIWNCNCGKQNLNSYQVCIRCNKIKPGIPGWVCSKCNSLNENENSYICISCNDIDKERFQEKKTPIVPKRNFADTKFEQPVEAPEKTNETILIWDCDCGTSNMPDFVICQKCYKLKPGVRGWVCEGCKTLNEEFTNRCSICRSTKDQRLVPEQEFWICNKCRSAISNQFDFCDNCMISKNGDKMVRRTLYDDKEDDKITICRHCKKKILKSSLKCVHCYKDLGDPEKIAENRDRVIEKNKNWTCFICKKERPSSMEKCFYCNTKKPSEEVKVNKQLLDDKQWICNKCKNINDSLYLCMNCHQPKPDLKIKKEDNVNPGWICKFCDVQMEYYDIMCTSCKFSRDRTEKKVNEPSNKVPKKIIEKLAEESNEWKCQYCPNLNKHFYKKCSTCNRAKTQAYQQGYNPIYNRRN